MRLDQPGLKQFDMLDLDAGIFQQADAGIEAVHHRRFIVHPGRLDIVAAFFQRRARGWRESDLDAGIACNRGHLLCGEGKAVDGNSCHDFDSISCFR